jgi:hypothetical protein
LLEDLFIRYRGRSYNEDLSDLRSQNPDRTFPNVKSHQIFIFISFSFFVKYVKGREFPINGVRCKVPVTLKAGKFCPVRGPKLDRKKSDGSLEVME